jgi:PAS domain S-box-containing protein
MSEDFHDNINGFKNEIKSLRQQLKRALKEIELLKNKNNFPPTVASAEKLKLEEYFRLLFDNNHAVMLVIDPDNGNIIDANAAAVSYYGWPKDVLTSMQIFQINILSPEEIAIEMNAAKERKRNYFIFKHRLANGLLRDVEVFSGPVKIGHHTLLYSIIHDISERKQIEIALKEQKELLESITNTSPVGITVIDKDGRISFANPVAEKILGLSENKVKQRYYNDPLWHITDLSGKPFPEERLPFFQVMHTGMPVFGIKHAIEWPDGQRIFISVNAAPIKDKEGNTTAIVASIEDITLRYRAEKELLKAKKKAEESDRQKSAFIANLSHEIRTPMNAILGFAHLLKEPDINPETRIDYINIIHNSGKHLLSIINDIIEISKIETKQITPEYSLVNVITLLDDVNNIIKGIIPANKNLEVRIKKPRDSSSYIIETDEVKLRQVLINLLTNAVRYTDKGYVEFGFKVIKDSLRFFVKDTGIGINKKYHKLIFGRFRQVGSEYSASRGGSGLGLAISKAYVQMLGGNISLKSEPGKGSLFIFTIPFNRGKSAINIA